VIDGHPHGPLPGTTTCQTYMRQFADGAEIVIEPWRVGAFPVIRDLVVDRGALDRIIAAGGYVSLKAGAAPDANAILVSKEEAELAFDAGQCIGCGACVAACPKEISVRYIAELNRDFLRAALTTDQLSKLPPRPEAEE
jgi:succinate dehydrogenase / fumarate reductase iron-sulfur subunit